MTLEKSPEEMRASIKRGLEQAAAGETVYLGSFAEYAEDSEDSEES